MECQFDYEFMNVCVLLCSVLRMYIAHLGRIFCFFFIASVTAQSQQNGSSTDANDQVVNATAEKSPIEVKLTIDLQNEGQPLFGNISANGSTFNVHLPKVLSINIGDGNYTVTNNYHDHDHDHDHDHTNDHNHDHAHDHDHDHDHNYQFPPDVSPADVNGTGFGGDNVANDIVDDPVVDAGNMDDA